MRLERPYIPFPVRVAVARRQLAVADPLAAIGVECRTDYSGDTHKLKVILALLFKGLACELHHRPALVNRRSYVRRGKTLYDPPANDPEHLVWLAEHDHDIETRVRGVGAQRSDLGQRRYMKRVAENRAKVRRPKRKWPSRPMRRSR